MKRFIIGASAILLSMVVFGFAFAGTDGGSETRPREGSTVQAEVLRTDRVATANPVPEAVIPVAVQAENMWAEYSERLLATGYTEEEIREAIAEYLTVTTTNFGYYPELAHLFSQTAGGTEGTQAP